MITVIKRGKLSTGTPTMASGKKATVKVTAWSPITLVTEEVICPLLATLQVAKTSGKAAIGAVINKPPIILDIPRVATIFSVARTVK